MQCVHVKLPIASCCSPFIPPLPRPQGHRLWSSLVPACMGACAGNFSDTASPQYEACAEECWRSGEAAHERVRVAGLPPMEFLCVLAHST